MDITTRSFYYIRSGEKNMMYTLRHYLVEGDHKLDSYIRNLSTDKNKAMALAKSIADVEGEPLLDVALTKLFDIERRSPEEIERANQQREAKKEADCQEIERNKQHHRELADQAFPVFPFGKHQGKTCEAVLDVDPEYVSWVCSQEFADPYSAQQFFLIKAKEFFQSKLADLNTSQHQKEIGDKVDIEVVCTKATGFSSDFGWTSTWINRYLCMDNDRNVYLIDYSGDTWNMQEQQKYQITGKVKGHDEYRGVKQTILTRVKAVKL